MRRGRWVGSDSIDRTSDSECEGILSPEMLNYSAVYMYMMITIIKKLSKIVCNIYIPHKNMYIIQLIKNKGDQKICTTSFRIV